VEVDRAAAGLVRQLLVDLAVRVDLGVEIAVEVKTAEAIMIPGLPTVLIAPKAGTEAAGLHAILPVTPIDCSSIPPPAKRGTS